jgi:xyloglucan-specific endo-beta-1,4-glucanase
MNQVCEDGDAIIMGSYWLNSNLWGAQTGAGSQCLWDTSANGSTITWGTRWAWTGQADAVKSYNCAVLGWHWGWKRADTGFPLRLSEHRNVHAVWQFDLEQNTPGGLNVSFDIWLSADPHLGNTNADQEIMIWLYRDGDISPIGDKQTTATIGGTDWELWEGSLPSCGWPVHSFVRTTNTNSASLNLTEFFDYLVSRGLSDAYYLISVEAGPEVFTGAGRLETTAYSVDIGDGSSAST